MYLVGTSKGLYKIDKEANLICDKEDVYDFILKNNDLYICSTESGVILNGKTILNESCWKFYEFNGQLIASVEGPKLYLINKERIKELIDLRDEGKKRGWSFPHSEYAHITDFAQYNGKIIASVEEGNLLFGDITSLKPLDFFNDSHNLLVKDHLYIATAYGLYLTDDLINYTLIEKGYFHGIEDLGNAIIAQEMSEFPLMMYEDGKLARMGIKLPRPTFGTNAIAKVDDKNIVYSTTSFYEINIKNLNFRKIVDIPMTRRVKVL